MALKCVQKSYTLRPPPFLVNFAGLSKGEIFTTSDKSVDPVQVRDVYKLEFEVFSNILTVLFYLSAVTVFATHACLGWKKLVPASAMAVPKKQQDTVIKIGYVFILAIWCTYASFPIHCYFGTMQKGAGGEV